MEPAVYLQEIRNRIKSHIAGAFGKRSYRLSGARSYVSFTFDDFPLSAYFNGGAILKKYELLGTFYVSAGMMNKKTPAGLISGKEILKQALSDGHELGCHTYDISTRGRQAPIGLKIP